MDMAQAWCELAVACITHCYAYVTQEEITEIQKLWGEYNQLDAERESLVAHLEELERELANVRQEQYNVLRRLTEI